jgi:hypothetical protein
MPSSGLASIRIRLFLVLVLPLAACVTSPAPEADQPTRTIPSQPFFADAPRWRPIFHGVEYAELATDTPRALVVEVLRVDSRAEGLELVTTPGNGDNPLETDGQTTRAFLDDHGLDVAINTHFFSPCCNLIPGEAKDLKGLAMAQGELVSPRSDEGQPDVMVFEAGRHEYASFDAMLVGRDELHRLDALLPTHAIAGRIVLRQGAVVAGDGAFSTDRHPRTLVGLSRDWKTMYLVTIDGRLAGYSTGASLAEAAAVLHHVGAWSALNVDGGGSTTMVVRDPDGTAQLVNRPSGGYERIVGSNLGLRARPVQPLDASGR